MSTALLRAHQVLAAENMTGTGRLKRVESAFNEVWYAGRYVIRVSRITGSRRLEYEVAIINALPAEVRCAPVMAYGRTAGLEYLVLERVPGTVLSRAWPFLEEDERRDAVAQIGASMQAIHTTPPPDGVWPPFLEGDTLEAPHQLPWTRVLRLAARAEELPHVPAGLIAELKGLITTCGTAFDDDALPGLVHGDLHLENVLWDGERVTLLDFEWARPASPDLDLDVLLRFCAYPTLHVSADYGHLVHERHCERVPGWLRESYPALFGHPRLRDRLTVYALSYDLRCLLLDPPTAEAKTLPSHHPINRLTAAVMGRSVHGWITR